MPVRVIKNRFPQIRAALRPECDHGVDDTADVIGALAKAAAPVRTGILVRVTKSEDSGTLHAQIESGIYRGHGFYAGFQEFGTSKMAAQPYMVPSAHAGEPVFVRYLTKAVQDACKA